MDIIVTPADDGKAWTLTDLLGRPMGRITEASAQQFTIHPDGHARETMVGIGPGPFASLDALWWPSRSPPGASASTIRARIADTDAIRPCVPT